MSELHYGAEITAATYWKRRILVMGGTLVGLSGLVALGIFGARAIAEGQGERLPAACAVTIGMPDQTVWGLAERVSGGGRSDSGDPRTVEGDIARTQGNPEDISLVQPGQKIYMPATDCAEATLHGVTIVPVTSR